MLQFHRQAVHGRGKFSSVLKVVVSNKVKHFRNLMHDSIVYIVRSLGELASLS